jgi:2-polyprenyl-6-methoxyphenol hydroxylase-like FAD-dependent oxidoreductase
MLNSMKILVVGAGIAGPSVCYWLKRFGFSPTLIEKSPSIRTGGQALDIRGVATDLTRKLVIYDKICDMRTQIARGVYIDTAGKVLHEEEGERAGFRQDDEVEIVRGDLVNILMQEIADVPCHFNQSIIDIEQNKDEVIVKYQDGRVENYDLVIGTDGIYSSVRRMTFDESAYKLVNLGAYICTYSIPNFLNLSKTEVTLEADHKLVAVNSDRDPSLAQADFMFRSSHVLRDIRDVNEQQKFLMDTYKDFGWETNQLLAYMASCNNFYFDAIAQVKMEEWTKGRVALIGDAGYCASPLSGQGNNLAMVGAYLLAGELKQAGGDYQRAFQRYNELMRPFVEVNQQFGAWVSESYLLADVSSKEVSEERSAKVMKMIKEVSNSILLPDYT